MAFGPDLEDVPQILANIPPVVADLRPIDEDPGTNLADFRYLRLYRHPRYLDEIGIIDWPCDNAFTEAYHPHSDKISLLEPERIGH